MPILPAGVGAAQRAARSAGRAGEEAAGIAKNTRRISSGTKTAAYRVPDGLTATTLTEVKNVRRLSLTNQVRDFAAYSSERGLMFDLMIRTDTKLTTPLQEFVRENGINLRTLKP